MSCNIVDVGKRRDGGTRYWCLTHHADATAKYGVKAERCRYAHVQAPNGADILKLDPRDYAGGIALWGAVAPIYDTTKLPIDQGVHVHARLVVHGKKEIDQTYRAVRLVNSGRDLLSDDVIVTELDGIYFMVSSIFNFKTEYVVCPLCKFPHLDKDWFSVHEHKRHLCAGCGRHFRDTKRTIGNPAAYLRELYPTSCQPTQKAPRRIRLKQVEYPGGIQVWGSNPAMIWTATKTKEEYGIHIHALSKDGSTSDSDIDDTYSEVTIDGHKLDVEMVQVFMAQSALPHIKGRVLNINCPTCNKPHFDKCELAFTPHHEHWCMYCKSPFRNKGRLRNTIGNPIVGLLEILSTNSVRPRQVHDMGLLPENI